MTPVNYYDAARFFLIILLSVLAPISLIDLASAAEGEPLTVEGSWTAQLARSEDSAYTSERFTIRSRSIRLKFTRDEEGRVVAWAPISGS